MKKLKVLHIISDFSNDQGGTKYSVLSILQNLSDNKKFEISILTSTSDHPEKIKNINFSYFKLFNKRFGIPDFKMIKSIFKIIKLNDIIHVHNFWNVTVSISIFISYILNKKIILTPHGSLDFYNVKKSNIKKKIAFFLFDHFNLKKIAKFHFLNEKEEKNCIYKLEQKQKKKILSNFINLKNKSILKKKNFLFKKKLIFSAVFLGRIHPIKNIEFQILFIKKMLQKNIYLKLNIYGPIEDFNYKLYLDGLILENSLQNYIKFKKNLYGLNKYRILNKSDFVFLTSKYECNSMVAIETILSGGCLVASSKTNLLYYAKKKLIINLSSSFNIFCNQFCKIIKNYKKINNVKKNAINFSKKVNVKDYKNALEDLYNF
jgi:glycosyltransferase involved in cell wall biosynthesis